MKLDIASVKFTYRNSDYFALVRSRSTSKPDEFAVTIMNGDLERQLYGSHIFLKTEDKIVCKNPPSENLADLASSVADGIQLHFKSQLFAN